MNIKTELHTEVFQKIKYAGFLDSVLDEQNNLYIQCLQIKFRLKLAVFYEQTLYLTTLKDCTCSSNVELSI